MALPAQLGCDLDEDPAAVLGVTGPARQTLPFQAVEQSGHRARADAGALGQMTGRHRPLLVEDVEAAGVGAVDAEILGHRLVDEVDRGLRRSDGVDERENQFFSRIV